MIKMLYFIEMKKVCIFYALFAIKGFARLGKQVIQISHFLPSHPLALQNDLP